MKQKVFDYIEELERKAKESEKYFKLWHEEKVKNNKAIEYIKELTDDNESVELMDISFYVKGELLHILQGVDKEGNELTIYARIEDVKERIENKEDEKEVLKEINNIHKEMNKLPLMQEFRNLIILYQKVYDECLFNVIGVNKE